MKSTNHFLSLYLLPTDRRLFALRQIRALADRVGADQIAELAADAIEHDEETWRLELMWKAIEPVTRPTISDVITLDYTSNRATAKIYEAMHDHRASSRRAILTQLSLRLFPCGLFAELARDMPARLRVQRALVDRLRRPEFAGWVRANGLLEEVDTLELNTMILSKKHAAKDPALILARLVLARDMGTRNIYDVAVAIVTSSAHLPGPLSMFLSALSTQQSLFEPRDRPRTSARVTPRRPRTRTPEHKREA